MSDIQNLVDALDRNTASNEKLQVTTQALLDLRTDAIEQVRAAAAPKGGKKTDSPAATVTTNEAAAATNAADATTTATATITNEASARAGADAELTEAQKVIGQYVNGAAEGSPEREARKAEVLKVLAHPKVAVTAASKIPEAMIPAVVKAVNTLIGKGNVIPDAPAEEVVEDLMG